jgi:hypothetical protein
MSSPRRAEALGMDRAGAVAHLDEQVGGMLDEPRRAADEDSRLLAGLGPTAVSMSASTRRSKPVQPAG